MSSIYGKKVVAVLDTQSNFGIQFQSVVDNVSALSTQMSTLLADSPDSLNTLNEIADALGDDPAFFSTMATANTTLQANIDALSTAAATARTTLQTALSGRLDSLEADATTATALSSLGTSLTAVDATLAGRLDTLESDPTTKTYVDAQVSSLINGAPDLLNTLDELAAAINDDENVFTSLTSADTALSARITTLEADPTTATALAALQTTVDANVVEAQTYFAWESNLAKVINPLRGSRIDVGNNITFYPAAGYNTEIKGNLLCDNNTKVFVTLTDAADDAAAATAGVDVGQMYRNGSVVMIRVS